MTTRANLKPMRSGAARTGLRQGLDRLATVAFEQCQANPALDGLLASESARLQSAILGGAIEAALDDLFVGFSPAVATGRRQDFWRLTNENLWRLTRALEASGKLGEVK